MSNSIYCKIEESKTGIKIPVLQNNKTIESRYNPEKEAENYLLNIPAETKYFIVPGLGSGVLISKIAENYKNCIILVIETSQDDFKFLKQITLVTSLAENSNIHFCTPENIQATIIYTYLPAKYGDLKIIERNPWMQENKEIVPFIQQEISKAINIVSADFSVQSHFGKVWQSNILNNLKLLSKNNFSKILPPDSSKNAYIVAAGPSLDNSIKLLKEDENRCIISTDTAYSTLVKYNLIPDFVISIDGQSISSNHFIKEPDKSTVYLFDLCSNFSASNFISQYSSNILYFTSGHPFSELANIYSKNKFLSLYSGSGTVTIAAVDFAVQSGFKTIKVLGADFGFYNGKSYTKGTYFDSLYNNSTTRIITSEKQYDNLLYRTELLESGNKKTTRILNAYQLSFEDYLKSKNLSFVYEDLIYKINGNEKSSLNLQYSTFDFTSFLNYLCKLDLYDLEIPLLPYIAWLKKSNSLNNYEEMLKLAQSFILSYN